MDNSIIPLFSVISQPGKVSLTEVIGHRLTGNKLQVDNVNQPGPFDWSEQKNKESSSRLIKCHHMLTENRKRQRSGGDEENGHLVPQAKRQSRGHPLSPEPGRDAWDSESSNSESSSSISSPEHAAGSCSSQCAVGPCSPLSTGKSSELVGPTNPVSYLQINRILKEAHFQSLQSRGHLRDT